MIENVNSDSFHMQILSTFKYEEGEVRLFHISALISCSYSYLFSYDAFKLSIDAIESHRGEREGSAEGSDAEAVKEKRVFEGIFSLSLSNHTDTSTPLTLARQSLMLMRDSMLLR